VPKILSVENLRKIATSCLQLLAWDWLA